MGVNSMLLRLMCNGYENRENKFEKKDSTWEIIPNLPRKKEKVKRKKMKSNEKTRKRNIKFMTQICA